MGFCSFLASSVASSPLLASGGGAGAADCAAAPNETNDSASIPALKVIGRGIRCIVKCLSTGVLVKGRRVRSKRQRAVVDVASAKAGQGCHRRRFFTGRRPRPMTACRDTSCLVHEASSAMRLMPFRSAGIPPLVVPARAPAIPIHLVHLSSHCLLVGNVLYKRFLAVAVVRSLIADIQAVADRRIGVGEDDLVVSRLLDEFMRRQRRQ